MKSYLTLNNEVLNQYRQTGTLDLEKDKEAARSYFLDEINVRLRYFSDTQEKVSYLVESGYYEAAFLQKYSADFVVEAFDFAHNFKHRFPTFMSAFKFYDGYAMKSRNDLEILEKFEDRIAVTALYLADGDEQFAIDAIEVMLRLYQPATPTTLNSGKVARGELVSCFEIAMDDTMNAIAKNIGYCLELSRLGGGVGINLTNIRPLGDPIKNIENRAGGIMPVAKLLENAFSYANQLGARAGAGVIWLNIFHSDIESMISSKKPNADEKIRLATLSTGVIIPDIFFELMEKDKDVVLFSPYDIYKEYGKRMSEISISDMYYDLLDNPRIRNIKRINARKLYTEIKKAQFESGYPFEFFDDNVNRAHPLKNIGRVSMSNLCSEILQVQEISEINDEGIDNKIGLDVSCNLGSIDVHAATKEADFSAAIHTSMRLLTAVAERTEIRNVPSVAKANKLMRSVGLGVMNVHGHLVANGIEYGSEDAVQFVDLFMESLNYFSLQASMSMAKEKQQTFYRFEESDYASGVYFNQYVKKEQPAISDKVQAALGSVPVITAAMWQRLKEDVQKYGVYNAYRLATPPTGSISYVRACTASLSPITEQIEVRDYADSRTIYPMPFLSDDTKEIYKEAYDIDMFKVVDMYAAATKHIDQGISMTLYVTDKWNTEQLARVYIYAWKKGIKTVYYVRQRLQDVEGFVEKTIEECISCAV